MYKNYDLSVNFRIPTDKAKGSVGYNSEKSNKQYQFRKPKNDMSSFIFSENITPRQKGSGSTELSSSYSEWKNEPPYSRFRHKKTSFIM